MKKEKRTVAQVADDLEKVVAELKADKSMTPGDGRHALYVQVIRKLATELAGCKE